MRGKERLGDLLVGGKIILKWLRMGLMEGSCKYGKEFSSSIKVGEFLYFFPSWTTISFSRT